MPITGGCRCGAVRYTIEAERITARHCWCRDCQYIGAGSGTVNVFFPSETVTVEGVLSDFASRAASGNLVNLLSADRRAGWCLGRRIARWSPSLELFA